MQSTSQWQKYPHWHWPVCNGHKLATETTFEICYLLPSLWTKLYFSVLLWYLKKDLEQKASFLFLIQRKSWSKSLFCCTGTFLEKGEITRISWPLHCPAFQSHKTRSNTNGLQVSTANFTQISHLFWVPLTPGQLRGIRSWESCAGLPPADPVPNRKRALSAMLLFGQRTLPQESSLLFSDLVPDTI